MMLQYSVYFLGSPSVTDVLVIIHESYKGFIFLGCHSCNLSRITVRLFVCLFVLQQLTRVRSDGKRQMQREEFL